MYRSFLIDIQHAEGSCLIVLSFIFDREDHDLIAGEAVALLLGDLKNQGHQLILVLLEITWNFIAENTTGAVNLAHDVAHL